MVDYFAIIHRYIPPNSRAYAFYVPHVTLVTAKALRLGRALGLSAERLRFVEEAGMLHDIGIVRVHEPEIGCTGDLPYICHGVEGRRILEAEGLPRHALVAERHIGTGLTAEEIERAGLPLPRRDMRPLTLEEELISYADLFFSKVPERLWYEKSVAEVRAEVARFGPRALAVFEAWRARFEPEADGRSGAERSRDGERAADRT